MRRIREVLRLRFEAGLSQEQIAHSCNIGRTTVREYLQRAKRAGVVWPLPEEMTDGKLEALLFAPPSALPGSARPLPDWRQVQDELKGRGVTLFVLWEEYKAAHPDGFQYSRFCDLYRAWKGKMPVWMRQDHKAGEKLFIDYAGMTMPVHDPKTGEVRQAQIFVATLGASYYTYAEATWSQTLPDFIMSHVRAFQFFGGVGELLVHCLRRCADSLNPGGHLAVLVADIRRKGRYYSILRELLNADEGLGQLRSVIIKAQHHTVSSRKRYRMEDPPIQHEYCVVIKRAREEIVFNAGA